MFLRLKTSFTLPESDGALQMQAGFAQNPNPVIRLEALKVGSSG